MKLRQRLVLTFLLIALILIAPALYGLSALRELRQLAYTLSTRDAVGALTLGRLQTAFGEVDNAERIYTALATQPSVARTEARQRVAAAEQRVEAELARLTAGGYQSVTAPAAAAWERLQAALDREQELIEAGEVAAADAHRDSVVDPAFTAVDRTLDPIGRAINAVGASQVERAQQIATRAATTTLLALAIALAIAVAIGASAARWIVRPIHQLRGAMSRVAEGDFEPEIRVSPERPDEMGDLARSFTWMTAQLAALDRMKAEFVSVASHELKTPLSVIKGYVSLLRDGIYGPVPDSQAKILTSIDDQSDRLGRLIQQLLDVSRFEAGGGRLEIRPVDLRRFLADLGQSFDVLAFQNEIDFRVVSDESLPPSIPADPDRLNEVLGNLLSNAFKFTPRGGRIELMARSMVRSGEDGVVIEVSDTGVGIPADEVPRIFEKFYQVENEAQPKSVGSGLGLAISREIVEAHGGTISAESEVGSGTTFRVILPVHARQPVGV